MLTEKELKKYNQYYFEQFGHEADINESRGSYSDYILKIVDAIITNTPIPRFPDDLTNAHT